MGRFLPALAFASVLAVPALARAEGAPRGRASYPVAGPAAPSEPSEHREHDREAEGRETPICTKGFRCVAHAPPSGVFGIRGSYLSADRVPGSDQTFGATLGARTFDYGLEGPFSYRGTTRWAIGGGSGGFEGALGASIAGGMRADVDEDAGLVLRVGAEGYLLGNKSYYASLLELPQVQLGFQLLDEDDLVEVGAKGGAVLAGKFEPGNGDAERRLGSAFEWGGYLSLHFPAIRFDATATRIEARKTGTGRPVDVLDGDLCVGRFVALCVDGRVQRGDVDYRDARSYDAIATYVGLTLGVAYAR